MLDSAPNASELGQRQYFTPPALAHALGTAMEKSGCILDISIGDGSLTYAGSIESTKQIYGIDIDPRSVRACNKLEVPANVATANLTHWHSIASELNMKFPKVVCNPPFSLKWPCAHLKGLASSATDEIRETYQRLSEDQDTMDSTIASMLIMLDLLAENSSAMLIANKSTIDRLADQWELISSFCYLRIDIEAEVFPDIAQWHNEARGEKNLAATTVLYFSHTHKQYDHGAGSQRKITMDSANPEEIKRAIKLFKETNYRCPKGPHIYTDQHQSLPESWQAVMNEYAVRFQNAPPEYNIHISNGYIFTNLTTFNRIKGTYTMELIRQLEELDGKSPAGLVVQANTRTALQEVIQGGMWNVHPDVIPAVKKAIQAYESERAPFFQPNQTMSLGWVDEHAQLEAISSELPHIKKGESYQLRTWTEETTWEGKIVSIAGDKERVKYRGNELVVGLATKDETGKPVVHTFHVRRDEKAARNEGKPEYTKKGIIYQYPIESIFQHFEVPVPIDIAEARPEEFELHQKNLLTIQEHIRKTLTAS